MPAWSRLYFVDGRRTRFSDRTREDEDAVQISVFDRIRGQLPRTDRIIKGRHRHDGHADPGNKEPPDRFHGIYYRLDAQSSTEAGEL